jgi:uncharacterized protein (DUF305 family)
MVNEFANVYPNINQFYMAALMAVPMVLIEILLMSAMYHNKRLNIGIAAASVLGFWFAIRQQTAIADEQFLKSMIPHHAGAILMCEKAALADGEIKELCRNIIASQQAEIDQMKAKLAELER